MDYEKKYKDVFAHAREIHRNEEGKRKDMEFLFPELKGIDDEEIKEEIINYFECLNKDKPTRKDIHNKWIAWLKRQGEQEEPQVYVTADGDSETEGHAVIKPKFHKGDWITCKRLNTARIINIDDDRYEIGFVNGIDKGFPHIDYIDRNFHLWTIQDAKDGDILAVTMYPKGTWIGIFKEQNGCTFSSYCFVNTKGIFTRGTHGHGNGEGIHPATKEQRNILFTKMKEAGYTFDFEKKELKEMEQNLAWREKYIADVFEKVGLAKIAREQSNDNLTNALQEAMIELSKFISQLKREWSEEDEKMFDYALSMIEWYSCINWDKSSFVSDWLKSLKDRYTWKPSDKQINTLEYYMHTLVCNEHKEILFGLYTDLKKLREE